MKKTFYILIVLFNVAENNLHSQPTIIKTPTNVSINAIVRSELSPFDLADIEYKAAKWIKDYRSSAVRKEPATATYNCHAYAWHMKDGGGAVWLNAHSDYDYDDDPEELSPYWSGASPTYETSYASNSTIAFYGSCWSGPPGDEVNYCDHSAKVISASLFESKWGVWPRYQHAPTDCPYNSSNITYYNVPIAGSNYVCSSPAKTFSTLNISGGGYTWTPTNVTLSGSGYSVNATPTVLGTTGSVAVSIASPYSGTTVQTRRSFVLGEPDRMYMNAETDYVGSGIYMLEPYNETEIAFSYTGPGSILERDLQIWDHSDWDTDFKGGGKVLLDYWHTPTPSNQNVYIRMRNECGWSLYKETTWSFYSPLPRYAVAPNPVKDNLSLLFEELIGPKGLPQYIELMHESSTIPVRSLKVNQSDFEKIKSNRNSLSLDVRDLPRGIYYLHVSYGEKNKPQMHRVMLE